MTQTIAQAFTTTGTGQDKHEIAHIFLPPDPMAGEWPKPRMALCGYAKRNPTKAPDDMPRCSDCLDIWKASSGRE